MLMADGSFLKLVEIVIGFFLLITALLKLTKPSHLYHILKKTNFWPGDAALYIVPVVISTELFLAFSLLSQGLSYFTSWLVLAFICMGSLHSFLGHKFNKLGNCGCYGPSIEMPIGLSLAINALAGILVACWMLFATQEALPNKVSVMALLIYPLGFILVRIGWNGWGFGKTLNPITEWEDSWCSLWTDKIKKGRNYVFLLENACESCKYWISKINLLTDVLKEKNIFVLSADSDLENLKAEHCQITNKTKEQISENYPYVMLLENGKLIQSWEKSFPEALNEKLKNVVS